MFPAFINNCCLNKSWSLIPAADAQHTRARALTWTPVTDEPQHTWLKELHATVLRSLVRVLKVEAGEVYPDFSQLIVDNFGRFADGTHSRLHQLTRTRRV